MKIAAQACAGLFNRRDRGSIYTRMEEKDDMWLSELALEPEEVMDAASFVEACMDEFPSCVLYSYPEQQALIPNILTVAAVLEAAPIDKEMKAECREVAFDATVEFKERNTPYLATKFVYENYVNQTNGLAMINPGYDTRTKKDWAPPLTEGMDPSMIDFVFSEKLFAVFLINGCIPGAKEHSLLNDIARNNPWPKPVGVYGYASYWMVFGGYLFEAQTLCADSRNMGAVPSSVNNLSFFSTRREPITEPGELITNEPENIEYDSRKTYVAFIVGDGDNISFVLDARARWFRKRVQACEEDRGSCAPLTWSISPHLARLAPDVLEWFYRMAQKTGKDYFTLPPSGHLYCYPSSLEKTTMQDAFVAATEKDARLLGVNSAVHWEWFTKWRYAEKVFLPKYARADGPIQGIFPVNVPYLFPTFTWKKNQFFKILPGRKRAELVLFRPREWRGVNDKGERMDRKFYLSPEHMAEELGSYPRGTVAAIYMTSDGGLTLENSFMRLVRLLPKHVNIVSAEAAIRLAVEAERLSGRRSAD